MSFTVGHATNNLSRRIWFTLGVLVMYRLGTHIPIPGIDPNFFANAIGLHRGVIYSIFAISYPPPYSMTPFALGILPYIAAAIILQLMSAVSPRLAALKLAGDAGRKRFHRYACCGAVLIAIYQSYCIAAGLESFGWGYVVEPGPWFRVTTILTMSAGVILLIWLAGQIDRRGIGPGAFLILASAIAAELPLVWRSLSEHLRTGVLGSDFGLVVLPSVVLAVVAASVVLANAHRPISWHDGARGLCTSETKEKKAVLRIPFCIAGLGPLVLVAMLVMPLPGAGSFGSWHVPLIQLGPPVNLVAAVVLVFVLTLLLAPVAAKSEGHATALRDRGAAIPGVRPRSVDTAAELDGVARRLAPLTGLLIALVFMLPDLLLLQYYAPWASSGVSLLILTFVMVAVARQIRNQQESGMSLARLGGASAFGPSTWVWSEPDDGAEQER